jgi:hypothetical protein
MFWCVMPNSRASAVPDSPAASRPAISMFRARRSGGTQPSGCIDFQPGRSLSAWLSRSLGRSEDYHNLADVIRPACRCYSPGKAPHTGGGICVSLPRVELGQPSFGRSAADSAARERLSPPRRAVGARWARQESNLHSRSDPFTAGCSRHMISSPVGCLAGTAPAQTRVTAGSLAFWVQAPVPSGGAAPPTSPV